jgi:hypothetical protein
MQEQEHIHNEPQSEVQNSQKLKGLTSYETSPDGESRGEREGREDDLKRGVKRGERQGSDGRIGELWHASQCRGQTEQ